MSKCTTAQEQALTLLEAAGGGLDYRREVFAFAESPEAPRDQRIQMQTAQALIREGVVVAERTKELRGKLVPDRIALATN